MQARGTNNGVTKNLNNTGMKRAHKELIELLKLKEELTVPILYGSRENREGNGVLDQLKERFINPLTPGQCFKLPKMIEQIKQLRVEIDGLAQLCEGLKPIANYVGGVDPYKDDTPISVLAYPNENSQEIKEAVKSLKLSKAWLGKVL